MNAVFEGRDTVHTHTPAVGPSAQILAFGLTVTLIVGSQTPPQLLILAHASTGPVRDGVTRIAR